MFGLETIDIVVIVGVIILYGIMGGLKWRRATARAAWISIGT